MKDTYKLLIILFMLQACTPLLIGVAGTVVVTNAVQEKSLGNAIDDAAIWTKINSALIQNKQFFNIKVRVDEGRVLLAGIIRDARLSLEVVKTVWNYNGVKEVINEIMVQEESESIVRSSWITTQIKTKLLVDHSVRSFDYTVITVDSIVYLFGIAQNNNELNKVIKAAGTVEGVEKVISHVRLKMSKLRRL